MSKLTTEELLIEGMTCTSCERLIKNTLNKKIGVSVIKVSYARGTVEITYDLEIINLPKIIEAIEELDYKVIKEPKPQSTRESYLKYAGIAIIIISLYVIIDKLGGIDIFNSFPEAREGMGYGMLFIIGLLTSIHCVAMCGGINLSQSVVFAKRGGNIHSLIPNVQYNLGRIVSYTIVGAIVGTFGQVITFSGKAQAIVAVIAGGFMIIMGVNMLNIFPYLRRININFCLVKGKISSNRNRLYVGLLNGLIPCGPLQAMQLFALSTASPIKGALSMFFFSLGTVPLMFGLGLVSSILSKKFKRNMTVISGVLIIILGITMFNRGMNLSGFNYMISSKDYGNNKIAIVEDTVQTITMNLSSGNYEPIVVEKDIPVKWIILAEKENINGCNNKIINQKFNIQKKLTEGQNIIEFIPNESGTFVYSCWMGMISSEILVVDNINNY